MGNPLYNNLKSLEHSCRNERNTSTWSLEAEKVTFFGVGRKLFVSVKNFFFRYRSWGRPIVVRHRNCHSNVCQCLRPFGPQTKILNNISDMIIIVYGSILRPSSNNRAALVGCQARPWQTVAPNICELALPTTHPPPSLFHEQR
jgi:hypothetical protein